MRHTTRGLSLIELIVAVSLIGILAAVVYAGLTDSQAQSRDAKRQADLRLVQNAVELYKNKYGRYPEACDSRVSGASPNWAGEEGTGYECSAGNEYIVGLAPEFIPTLPRDPRAGAGGNNSGYVYAVNGDGSVFKFMALNSVETETVPNNGHEFFRCGSDYDNDIVQYLEDGNSNSYEDAEMCERSPTSQNAQGVTPWGECANLGSYATTYAVSGGFAPPAVEGGTYTEQNIEYFTERLRCR